MERRCLSPGRPTFPASRHASTDTLLASARAGFLVAGRGVAVIFDDQEGVRYSTIEDLRGALAKAPELEGLIEVVREAVETYDPEREAVVLESGYDAVSVFLVREGEVVTLGTLAFVTPTYAASVVPGRGEEIRPKRARFCAV